MKEERSIDLERYIPKKAKKGYLLKILLYTLVLGALMFFMFFSMNKKSEKLPEQINGVEVQIGTKMN